MIKIQLASLGEGNPTEVEIKNGSLLSEVVSESVGHLCESPGETFNVVLNGHIIHPDLWAFTKLKSSDEILIAPKIQSGNTGSILKTVAIVLVTAYVGPLAAGAFGAIGGALVTAAATIGASLLLNSLFPPPSVDEGNLSYGNSESGSQMYSISGQSNKVDRFGSVPKVYGRHRIFPRVAANPYVELEADPETGKLVQYFYAIYDFGFGPLRISDIKIGDTPIENFSDVTYNLVDLNKPGTSEGVWDDALKPNFTIYKGDVTTENVGVAINGNEYSGSPLDEYQVIRNANPNTLGTAQEITLSFGCPQGLIAYSAQGDPTTRNIDLEIKFAKVGTEDWKAYNDPDFVSYFKSVGGGEINTQHSVAYLGFSGPGGYYQELAPASPWRLVTYTDYTSTQVSDRYFGFPAGNTIVLGNGIPTNSKLFWGNTFIGRVLSASAHSPGFSTYTLDSTLPSGMVQYVYSTEWFNNQGSYSYTYTSSFTGNQIYYTDPSEGGARISGQESSTYYATFKFTPKIFDDYKVRITRLQSSSSYTSTVRDGLVFSSITTRADAAPIVTDKRHVFLELQIRATNQLNGTIQNLSAVAESALMVWDGANWTRQLTSNPAWVFADLLTSEVNKRPLPVTKLETNSLLEWAEYCDETPTAVSPLPDWTQPRFRCNFILDFDATLNDALHKVSSASQASLNIIDGKYGVLIDKLRTTPVQIFTPRNSTNFTSQRNYSRKPHAVAVKYIDPSADWEVAEKIVYDDGYNELNTTETDQLTSFACTNAEQAWRFGRYFLAANRLRQENISIDVDFEHLVCTRGDYVQIAQDVMKVGGFPARVKSISGNTITIDDGIETNNLLSYGYVFRGSDGVILEGTLSVVASDQFTLVGPLPDVGDLVVIGEVTKIYFDCIVKSISPADNLTATLILVEKADALYDAETGAAMTDYSPQINNTTDIEYSPPAEVENLVVADNGWECSGAGYLYYVDLDWDMPIGSAVDTFEIWVNDGRGYDLKGFTKNTLYRVEINQTRLNIEHSFKVLGVSASGKKLDLGTVSAVVATPQNKSNPPSNVESLNIDITGEVLQLVWPAILDCDCDEYLIRYSPNLASNWETSTPLLRMDRNSTLASTQARTGVYFIKAIDFNGNESAEATRAITTIPNLFSLNVIDTVTDFPSLGGDKFQTEVVSDSVMLKHTIVGGVETAEYYSDGYYYFTTLLNLGEIYTVRLQSLIEAEGFTIGDLMSSWASLDAVTALTTPGFSDWDLKTQYRTTENLNVISEWDPMGDVLQMSAGDEDIWSPWRDFIMGDATGKIFQFRLKLISNKVSVTPRVVGGHISADMPDRFETVNNVSVGTSGTVITYSPAFAGPSPSPNIQVSIDSAQSGDYWNFDYKTTEGFKIRIYDKDGNPVSRNVDFAIKGYGRRAATII